MWEYSYANRAFRSDRGMQLLLHEYLNMSC
ncbi:hypothetical protein HBN54_004291 [Hymenobacter sp. 1B]|uniref:Transposase n=1 Tax=Hymenobacter artigasi TaxID=2719616 RepID=A0ABX1HR77_9BACT|nr:hypothetical protein [Hymenobacter artigasi]